MSATVRFSKVVASSGKPRLHTLWGPLKEDAEFQGAVKTGRVMTVRQENVGSKKDFGLIGFSDQGTAQYLIFPKPLRAFEGRRVVGIKYEVFDAPVAPVGQRKSAAAFSRATKPSKDHRPAAFGRKAAKAKPPLEIDDESLPPAPSKSVPPERVTSAQPEPNTSKPAPESSQVRSTGAHVRKRENHSARSGKEPGEPLERKAVIKEVRAALRELEAGKAVVVFRRLESLAKRLEGA